MGLVLVAGRRSDATVVAVEPNACAGYRWATMVGARGRGGASDQNHHSEEIRGHRLSLLDMRSAHEAATSDSNQRSEESCALDWDSSQKDHRLSLSVVRSAREAAALDSNHYR